MARVNNPVVGTLDCADCGTVASLHETKRGKGSGLLYKRCECGCDQRTGKAVQKQWRAAMTPRPGFEHLSEEPEQPNETAPVLEPLTEAEPEEQPKTEPESQVQEPVKGGTVMPLIVGLLGFSLFVITRGAGGGPMS